MKDQPRSRVVASILLIGFATVAAFSPIFEADFVLDDRTLISENPLLAAPPSIGSLLVRPTLSFSTDQPESKALYRPLWLGSFILSKKLWKDNPLGYHAENLAIHLLCTGLVWLLLSRITPRRETAVAAMGAAVFALHPIHVEAVAWISARGQLLSALGILICAVNYLAYRRTGRRVHFWICVVAYGLALLAHEGVITVPLVFVAGEMIHRRRHFLLPVVLMIAAAGYLIWRAQVLGALAPLEITDSSRWLALPMVGLSYLRFLVWPWPQHLMFALPESYLTWPEILAVSATSLGFLIVNRRRMKTSLVWVAVIWFAVTLLPALAAGFASEPVFALRFLYLPSVAVPILVAAVMTVSALSRKTTTWLLTAVCVVLGGWTFVAAADWQNEETLGLQMLEAAPGDARVHRTLAKYHVEQGACPKAIIELHVVVELTQGHERADALETLGYCYFESGDIEASRACLSAAVEIDPQRSSSWLGLGNLEFHEGDFEQALDLYLKAASLDDKNPEALRNVALVYRRFGNTSLALDYEARARAIERRSSP